MDVVLLPQCQREILDFPEDVRGDVVDCIARLRAGLVLSMPLSRPMPSVGKGVHELRLKDRSGQYRVIYFVKKADAIFLIHAFVKKTEKTSQRDIDVALKRMAHL
jgi:phage-related protein